MSVAECMAHTVLSERLAAVRRRSPRGAAHVAADSCDSFWMTRSVVELAPGARTSVPAAIAALVPADARALSAVLELGYLAASADGLDASERAMLSKLLEQATRARFDEKAFHAHFYDLDSAVALLGRHERLARTAAELETDVARQSGLRFAALVAMADGALGESELAVLVEAGSHFGWSAEQVRSLVEDTARTLGEGAAS